ncbi:hypothetical protein NFI96_033084 [Prochilodus magdalenae]|nr:hypothetical protein NFI96_033084 [Prochilodus magdalenae]
MIATTTKICTRGGSTRVCAQGFHATAASSYSSRRNVLEIFLLATAGYGPDAPAPSIFRVSSFGREKYVVSKFHGVNKSQKSWDK